MAERRLYFDERRFDPDVVDVLQTAAVLEVTEFELFRLAYQWWFGNEITDTSLERYYLPYMFKDSVPSFVRQFIRHVKDREEAGRLDKEALGIKPHVVTMDMYNRGVRYLLWIVVIMGTLLTGAMAIAEFSPWLSGCTLPPCY
ncbi:MAG: hypothetical protein ACFB6S_07435 [Geminicoccaceae bacterium]